MLSFNCRSLTFKPALDKDRRISIGIKLADGSIKQTEPTRYDKSKNLAVFSEVLEFKVADVNQSSYFTLIIYEVLSDSSKEVIISKAVHLERNLESDTNKIAIEIRPKQDVIVHFSVLMTEEFKNSYKYFGADTKKDDDRTPTKADIDFLRLAPLMKRFIKSLTPVVHGLDLFNDLRTWKNPAVTLVFGLVTPIVLLYSRWLLFFSCLAYLLFGHLIIGYLIRVKVVMPKQSKLDQYARNLELVQNKFDELVSDDKSKSLEMLLHLQKFMIVFIVLLAVLTTTQFLVLIFWTFLLVNTPQGSKLFLSLLAKAGIYGEKLNEMVLKNINLKVIQNIAQVSTGQTKKQEVEQIETKKFVTWENQRWWLGKGWCAVFLPGDRPGWSDQDGKIEQPREKFKLPGDDWQWDGEWRVAKDGKGDEEGWEYAPDFYRKEFHSSKATFDVVRKRKWTRTCFRKYLSEVTPANSDAMGESQPISLREKKTQ